MTTLILGGTGFIGARVAHRLVEGGERVVSLDVVPDAASVASLRDKVTLLHGDVGRIEDVLSAVKSHRVTRIVDMAYILNSESDQEAHTAVRVNVLGVSNAFEAARLLDVERVVYASSISVYGDQSLYGERPVAEQDMPAPASLYGVTKLLNEHEAALYRQSFGMSLIGVRIGVVFGHGRLRGQGLWAAQFASEPAVGKPAALPFTGNTRASLIHVDDVAELFARILAATSPLHAIYNAGGDNVSLDELVDQVRRIIPDAEYIWGTGRLSLPYWVDSSRAEAEFDWRRRPLPERIAEHIAEARAAQSG
ncbi:MAG: NAD(P)-dependent oxidoreductase [Anaerolineae bacterium]|nr:NAD(P)-dependent oxidoreductase [Anaerolineae bacterium]